MKASEMIDNLLATCTALVKLPLLTRRTSVSHIAPMQPDTLVILANGPSLRRTIADDGQMLASMQCMAVNFAANTLEFDRIMPHYYVLVDPHFFDGVKTDDNVARLWKHLAGVGHNMVLYVPCKYRRRATKLLGSKSSCRVEGFNAVGVEGAWWLRRWAYKRGLAMPRPRNVLIPAIMVAIQAGFKRIMLAGADHSWMQTLSVNDNNEVVSIQPHYYEESQSERDRVAHVYKGYKLHQIVQSFYVAFRSYHDIARYARERGVTIYNVTPGSMIDAFERSTIKQVTGIAQ